MSYQYLTTDFNQDTNPAFDPGPPPAVFSPGGPILAGESDSHVYGLGLTFTPWRRFSLIGTFNYQKSATTTANPGVIPPYEGDIYSALLSGTYILTAKTDFLLNYAFSLADYSQPDPDPFGGSPPPLGIHYQQHAVRATLSHRVNRNITTRLQYGFYYYAEPSLVGADNYRAHTIFATLTFHLD